MGYFLIVKAKLDDESRIALGIISFSCLPSFDPGRPELSRAKAVAFKCERLDSNVKE